MESNQRKKKRKKENKRDPLSRHTKRILNPQKKHRNPSRKHAFQGAQCVHSSTQEAKQKHAFQGAQCVQKKHTGSQAKACTMRSKVAHWKPSKSMHFKAHKSCSPPSTDEVMQALPCPQIKSPQRIHKRAQDERKKTTHTYTVSPTTAKHKRRGKRQAKKNTQRRDPQ